jgi:hypothetical protein
MAPRVRRALMPTGNTSAKQNSGEFFRNIEPTGLAWSRAA